jgi:hypothetical protein
MQVRPEHGNGGRASLLDVPVPGEQQGPLPVRHRHLQRSASISSHSQLSHRTFLYVSYLFISSFVSWAADSSFCLFLYVLFLPTPPPRLDYRTDQI